MIRKVLNRFRRNTPVQQHAPMFTHDQAPQLLGRPVSDCGASSRRGTTRRPLGMVRLQNRRRNQIARASRKRNRTS